MVLESWCYTRKGVQQYSRRNAAQFQGIPNGVSLDTNSPEGGRGGPGGLVLYQGDWIPGNSRLCSSVQIPQIVAMTARGVDTNGLRHLYQGSVGDSKHWIKVHTGSLTFTLFIPCHYCFNLFIPSRDSLFILGGDLNHTNAHGVVSVWRSGIPQ